MQKMMRTRHTTLGGAVAAALCGALGACAGEGGGPQAIRIDTLESGTVAVRNPERGVWTQASAWRAVEELRLGAAEGAGPTVFGIPAALEVDAYGRLYVLEAATGEVRVFEPDGRHLRSLGRQGSGPGELRQPIGLTLAPDGALWVVDPGNARFTIFDTAGTLRGSVRRDNGFAAYPWPGRFDRRGRLWDVAQGSSEPGSSPALLRIDPASGRADRLPLPAFTPEQFVHRRGGVTNAARVPYAPELAWTLDAEGRVWSGVTDRYRLRLHEPGGDTLRLVERAMTPVAIARAELDSVPAQLKWFTDQGGRVDVARLPEHKPAYVSVRTDDRGWLWVRPSLPATERNAAFDVFDPEGRYQGRVSLPVPLADEMPMIVRGNDLYAVVLGDTGVPQVIRFRIEGRDAVRVAGTHGDG